MDPAAELLKRCRSRLELFSQGQQQQQHVGEQEDRELQEGREKPAEEEQPEEDKRERKEVSKAVKMLNQS